MLHKLINLLTTKYFKIKILSKLRRRCVHMKLAEKVTWKNLPTGFVLLDLESGNYFTLNETASIFVQGITNSKPLETIVDQITEEYDITKEQAQSDIDELIVSLESEGLLVKN